MDERGYQITKFIITGDFPTLILMTITDGDDLIFMNTELNIETLEAVS